ncbi:MAG: DUF1638 domain-containing protein [Defluviitaleaceae bacterium]|nr:DUF1638 domain-containing protein [Defluviitaleaceae bacterium]
MRIKLICCDVFLRQASAFIAASPHIIDVEYVPMLAHNKPDTLRAGLQARINAAAAARNYDLFLLLYGLCGNSTVGLTSPVKLIMPRVHDCCTMFMGSYDRFAKEFGNNLSMRWCTSGYYERSYLDNAPDSFPTQSRETYPEYRALVEQYGEDNAEYIWDTLHPDIETPEAAYIRLKDFESPSYENDFRGLVENQGKTLRVVEGDTSYIQALINGPWDNKRFLTINPGEKIGAVYDMHQVVTAEPV